MGKSAIGAGRKAGFYNYLTQFVEFNETNIPTVSKKYSNELVSFISSCREKNSKNNEFLKLEHALQSYMESYENEFSSTKDYANVRGEDNHFKYVALKNIVIRVEKSDSIFDVISRILAARVSNVTFTVSINNNDIVKRFLVNNTTELFTKKDTLIEEDEKSFVNSIKNFQRVIFSDMSKVPNVVFKEAAKTVTFIVRQKPMMEGRLELLNYFEEQSISHSYHRYGNIGARAHNL